MTHKIHSTILFIGDRNDVPYISRLKSCVGTASVKVKCVDKISTITEVVMGAKSVGATAVITTSPQLLRLLLPHLDAPPKIDNYAGSMFARDGIEILFIDPLKQLMTLPYGVFVTRRYISKLLIQWRSVSQHEWCELTPANATAMFTKMASAYVIAVDIETKKEPLVITQINYTGVFSDGTTYGLVLNLNDLVDLEIMRKFNWHLKAPKVLQNGKYDIAYLARFNAPLYNYIFDTASLFHCWYSELPKDLATLAAFFIRDSMYWKDLAHSGDLQTQMLYNAKDGWNTAEILMAMVNEMPAWVTQNYLMEFPLVYPTHMCEMRGIKRDSLALATAITGTTEAITSLSTALDNLIGAKGFNVASPIQMKLLLKALGCGDLQSADEKNLEKAKYRHPLNDRILGLVVKIRKQRKLLSTYLTDKKDFNGRVLYSEIPWGTDTGRLASGEHPFWCGANIQNIPRGKAVKQTMRADAGFVFCESDLEQAESRDTAHIAGEERMIAAVCGERDFHSVNAAAFFGVTYESIFDQAQYKSLNKALRDLAKRVNHGANYNMGPGVLVDTMGQAKIFEAKRLLGLPNSYREKEIAQHLLGSFHKAYPGLAANYYSYVKHAVATTKKLVGATGWTRYCFGDPVTNKQHLNAYIAHCPQSLNAMTLNKAFMKVFYNIAMNPQYCDDFKLLAQIHDSILFQFRKGRTDIAAMVKDCMEIPVTITGCDGKTRTFTVPAALKDGPDHMGALYWSETE